MELLPVQDVRAQRRHIRFLLNIPTDQPIHIRSLVMLRQSVRKNGKTYRKIVYRADFSYYDKRQGKYIVEDTKGFQTDVYRLKKKLFEYRYPDLEIVEVFQRGQGKR